VEEVQLHFIDLKRQTADETIIMRTPARFSQKVRDGIGEIQPLKFIDGAMDARNDHP
jgi:hypothetical protein